MGMYTELVFAARLRPKLPKKVLAILEFMVSKDSDWKEPPEDIPVHPFFQTERWTRLFRCGSYYFGIHKPHAILEWDDISTSYSLSTRSSLKNYEDEIGKFLDWIRPYVSQGSGRRGMYATVCYEEDDSPTMHFIEEGDENSEVA